MLPAVLRTESIEKETSTKSSTEGPRNAGASALRGVREASFAAARHVTLRL